MVVHKRAVHSRVVLGLRKVLGLHVGEVELHIVAVGHTAAVVEHRIVQEGVDCMVAVEAHRTVVGVVHTAEEVVVHSLAEEPGNHIVVEEEHRIAGQGVVHIAGEGLHMVAQEVVHKLAVVAHHTVAEEEHHKAVAVHRGAEVNLRDW